LVDEFLLIGRLCKIFKFYFALQSLHDFAIAVYHPCFGSRYDTARMLIIW